MDYNAITKLSYFNQATTNNHQINAGGHDTVKIYISVLTNITDDKIRILKMNNY